MAKTGGVIGKRIRVAFSLVTSPPNYLKVEQVRKTTIPVKKADRLETTVASNSYLKTHRGGLQDVSDFMLEVLRDSDPTSGPNQKLLKGYNTTQTELLWRVEIPADSDATVDLFEPYTFSGTLGGDAPVSDLAVMNTDTFTVIITDTATFTSGDPAASVIG